MEPNCKSYSVYVETTIFYSRCIQSVPALVGSCDFVLFIYLNVENIAAQQRKRVGNRKRKTNISKNSSGMHSRQSWIKQKHIFRRKLVTITK